MTETFISFGADANAVAKALADCLMRHGIAVTQDCGKAADSASDERSLFTSIDRADRVVLLVTPCWAMASWPLIERYIARALSSPAAFLEKLAIVDLSEGAAVPALLRPLVQGDIGIKLTRAASAEDIGEIAASAGLGRLDTDVTPVFVVGHPGSGKSTFCALLQARLAAYGIPTVRVDAYPFLQTLFRMDELRNDTTRFESDALCEFVIKDASVLEDSIMLMKNRLQACDGAVIVELAFSEGQAMADILSSSRRGPIVHVDASLDACIRNNAARGAILQQALRKAAEPGLAFDSRSDVHYVPPAFYERYQQDPRCWQDGAALFAARFADRYHRIGNAGSDLSIYLESCRAFIDATLLPMLAPATYPRPTTGLGRDR